MARTSELCTIVCSDDEGYLEAVIANITSSDHVGLADILQSRGLSSQEPMASCTQPPPTAAELREAVLWLAKQGYAEHSRRVKVGRGAFFAATTQGGYKGASTPSKTPVPAPTDAAAWPAIGPSPHPAPSTTASLPRPTDTPQPALEPPTSTPTSAPTSSRPQAQPGCNPNLLSTHRPTQTGPTTSLPSATPQPQQPAWPLPSTPASSKAPCPTPSCEANVPGGCSPAPSAATPTPLQGAWAQAASGSVNSKKWAALDARLSAPGAAQAKGQAAVDGAAHAQAKGTPSQGTPATRGGPPSAAKTPAGGAWAAGSPAISTFSTASVTSGVPGSAQQQRQQQQQQGGGPSGAWGRGGQAHQQQQQQLHGQGGTPNSTSTVRRIAPNPVSGPSPGSTVAPRGAWPAASPAPSPAPAPATSGGPGMGVWAARLGGANGASPSPSGGPAPLGEDAAAQAGAGGKGSSRRLRPQPVPAPGAGGGLFSPTASATGSTAAAGTGAWGVAPVVTSAPGLGQHEAGAGAEPAGPWGKPPLFSPSKRRPQGPAAAGGPATAPVVPAAAAAAVGGATFPPLSELSNQQPASPRTPLAGRTSPPHPTSTVGCSGLDSPPSVTSYPKGPRGRSASGAQATPPVPHTAAASIALDGHAPPAETAAANPQLAAAGADAPAGPADGQGTAGTPGDLTGLGRGAEWGPPLHRLARLHAAVLCAGRVGCLQDEVAELLHLLACPKEALVQQQQAPQHQQQQGSSKAAGAAPGAAGTTAAAAGGEGFGPWSLPAAVQYACAVLAGCSGLLSGLGHRLVAAVAACAASRLAAPALAEAAEAAAARRERSHTRSRAVDALGAQRQPLVGPMLAASHDAAAGKSRSAEQQRRTANRERCRDAFFAWVRQATTALGAADQPPPPGGPGTGGPAAAAAAECLVPLRSQCLELLHSLHPDSLPFLAELITGCVMQAAVTGESLVEGDLASLAQRNPSKFQRLNQRMTQGSSGTGAATGTGSGLRTARPSYSESNAAPSGGGGGGRAPYSSTAGPTSSYGGGGGAGGGTRGGGGGGGGGAFDSGTAGRDMSYGLAARCAAILSRLPAFPPPQRPFVFFLEAADSHLLLTAVARCMAGVLQAMLTKVLGAPSSDGGASSSVAAQQQQQPTGRSLSPLPAAVLGPLGDRAVASGALCSYLAYLCAVHGVVRYGAALPEPAVPYTAVRDAAAANRHAAPLDVLRLLRVSEERGAVLHVVPCVTSYLDYLAQGTKLAAAGTGADGADGEGGGSGNAAAAGVTGPADAAVVDPGYCRAVARQLRRLLSSRVLQPSEPYFCTAGLCLRSALEDALGYVAAMAGPEVLQGDEEEGSEEEGKEDDGEGACRQSGFGAATGGKVAQQGGVAAAAAGKEEQDDEGTGKGDGAAAGVAVKGVTGTERRKALQPWEQLLAASLQDSDGLIDSRFLEHCCPALEEASRVLQRAAAAAAAHPTTSGGGGASCGALASPAARDRGGGDGRPLGPRRVPQAPLVRVPAPGGGSATAAAALIPDSVAEVLAGRGPSRLQQALAQALLSQYSSPGLGLGLGLGAEAGGGGAAGGAAGAAAGAAEAMVPMRDVVGYVTGVLAVNGTAAALEVVVPQVVALQLRALAEELRPLLTERSRQWQEEAAAAADANTPVAGDAPSRTASLPPPLPLPEALSAAAPLLEGTAAAAVRRSLEAALPAVRQQLRENALRSLQALLPGTVPEEAVAAAAGLAAQSAEVSCLQRLVAQVPAVVRGQLDDQIKSVVREVLREVERAAADGDAAPVDPTTTTHGAAATDEVPGPDVGAQSTAARGASTAGDAGVEAPREGPADGASRAVEGDAGAPDGVEGTGVDAAGVVGEETFTDAGREGQQQQQGQGGVEQQREQTEKEGTEEEKDSPAAVADRLAIALLSLSSSASGEQQGQGQGQEREKEGGLPLEQQLVSAALAAAGGLLSTAPAWTPGEEPPPAVAAAVTLAARTLYGTVRRSVRLTAGLERLLIAVLRATSAAAAERVAGVGSGMGMGGQERAGARAVMVGGAGGGRGDVCTALVLLAEVALGVIQQHGADAPNWVHAVWAGGQDWDDEDGDEQEDGDELGERGPGSTADAQDGAQEGGAAAAGEERAGGREAWGRLRRPPMVVNLYSQVAVYGRDLEVYRPLHVLRTALQRVTLGPVVGGVVLGPGAGEGARFAVLRT